MWKLSLDEPHSFWKYISYHIKRILSVYINIGFSWMDWLQSCSMYKIQDGRQVFMNTEITTRSRQNTRLRYIYGRERNLVGITPLQLIYWDYLLGAEVSLLDGKWVIWFIRKVTRVCHLPWENTNFRKHGLSF